MEFEFNVRLCTLEDIPELRKLINSAYKQLMDRGLNYTGAYQDEATTWDRVSSGRAFVVVQKDQIIATILLKKDNLFTKRNTAYIGQFAVNPELQKSGIGSFLMDYCEKLALAEGYDGVQLDTAQPAAHLVNWYKRRGYEIVGEVAWEGKTYKSWIFEKLFVKKVERLNDLVLA